MWVSWSVGGSLGDFRICKGANGANGAVAKSTTTKGVKRRLRVQ